MDECYCRHTSCHPSSHSWSDADDTDSESEPERGRNRDARSRRSYTKPASRPQRPPMTPHAYTAPEGRQHLRKGRRDNIFQRRESRQRSWEPRSSRSRSYLGDHVPHERDDVDDEVKAVDTCYQADSSMYSPRNSSPRSSSGRRHQSRLRSDSHSILETRPHLRPPPPSCFPLPDMLLLEYPESKVENMSDDGLSTVLRLHNSDESDVIPPRGQPNSRALERYRGCSTNLSNFERTGSAVTTICHRATLWEHEQRRKMLCGEELIWMSSRWYIKRKIRGMIECMRFIDEGQVRLV